MGMRIMAATLFAGALGGFIGSYGDLPNEWAQSSRLYHAVDIGDADYLAEVLGCTLQEAQVAGRSMQCGETFLWLGPAGSTGLSLGSISNVQVEGYAREARAFTATVGTRGAGGIDDGVLFHGQCYGDLGSCVILRGQGWQSRVVGDRLELVAPGGEVQQSWIDKSAPRRRRP